MLYVFGKPVLAIYVFKYLKMIISKKYDLQIYFSKGLFFEDLWI